MNSQPVKWLSYPEMAFCTLLVTTLSAGCSSSPTLVGPRPPKSYRVLGPVQGSACGAILGPRFFFFGADVIPVRLNSRTERAYAEALAGGASGLIDAKVRERRYPLIFGQLLCTDIAGTAVRETPRGEASR